MRILILIINIFLFSALAYSQDQRSGTNEDFIFKLTIENFLLYSPSQCKFEVNVTLFADGKVESEDCRNTRINESGKKVPVKIVRKSNAGSVSEYIQFIEKSGFLEAEKVYKGKMKLEEGVMITTMIYKNKNIEKKVVIENYDPFDLSLPCFLSRIIHTGP